LTTNFVKPSVGSATHAPRHCDPFNSNRGPLASRQAADQAEQGGCQTDPGTAPRRAAIPSRGQRSSGDQPAQPDHSGMGRLRPERDVQRNVQSTGPYLWQLTYNSGRRQPREQKPKSWVFRLYFGKFNKARQDRWAFGDRITGAYMHRFAWTTIVRHPIVKQGRSPDDRPLPSAGPGHDAKRRCRSTTPPCAALPSPGRPLPGCRSRSAHRRSTATNPTSVGAVAHDHPPPTITLATTRAANTDEAGYRLTHTRCHQGSL
jgi:hypothetical protein